MRSRTGLLALFLVAAALPAAAQRPTARRAPARAPAVTVTPGPTVEGISEYTLSNGLRVLLFPDASQPTATVNITYLVGSRHEGYGEKGMAHLLEHMVFKGTPRHPNIPQELTEHGAQPNGTTWFDRTNYFETFAATDTNLTWALDLEADRMVNSTVSAANLASEFSVVRNEFESGENDPSSVLMERVMSTMFLWHNYGASTIGARSDIEKVPAERLRAFYQKYYQPDNAVLVVAGKFDPTRALALIKARFGRIPRPVRTGANTLWNTYTAEPEQDGERSVTLRRVGDVAWIIGGWHIPPGSHTDFAAVDVLSNILGDEPSGRLYKALVLPHTAASVFAFNFQLKEPGVLLAMAQLGSPDSAAAATEAIRRTMAEVITSPPTTEEVERAKQQLLKQVDLTLNNSQRAALSLSEWAAMGDWRLLFLHRDRIRAVTTADVARVAAAYLKPSNATWGTFVPTPHPDRAPVVDVPDVAAMVANYRGDTARAAGEVFDPSPANIESRTTRATLANGFALALLPKKTRGATVNATITLRFGSLAAARGKATIGSFAGSMLMRGSSRHTRQQIQDEFDRLKAQVNVFGGVSRADVRIETIRENLPAVLRLVGEVLKTPVFDTTEFETLRAEQLAGLDEQRSEPTALGSNAYSRALNPWPDDDPRAILTLDAQAAAIRGLRLAQLRDFHRGFYGADHGQMAVVGDFDAGEVRRLADSLFGAWRSPIPFERIPAVYQAPAAQKIVLKTPDKANAFFLAGMNLQIRNDDTAYAPLLLGNYIMGGGFLNSRLATRIRQKDGISYGVGSGVFASALDQAGGFQSYAIYAPENVGRLETAFNEEVARVLQDGYTAEELDKARQGYLQQRELGRSNNSQLSAVLADQLFTGRNMGFEAELDRRIGALTVAQVNAAVRRFIDPARFITVEAGDFDKHPPVAPTP
jgi:zinc protease